MRPALATAACILLAGCMTAADSPVHSAEGDVPLLAPGGLLSWSCDLGCADLAFDVAVPAGFDGWLDVRVRWDGTQVADLALGLDAPGAASVNVTRGFDDRVAQVLGPTSGRHVAHVEGPAAGATVTARLGSLSVPAEGALLPNLVELVIEGPAVGPCDDVERAEQGARKCMRFGNGVGNPGDGPMQIRLSLQEGALALGDAGGRFVQEVRRADGGLDSHEVGPAVFHPSHEHWHYDGFALFELYAVDPATGLRGELARSHHKSGFCFLDWDEMREGTTVPADQERAETDCLVPGLGAAFSGSTEPPAWTNGISRGWYDFYEPELTDQYVDIDGLPAGLYELVATADPEHTLAELDPTDNQSSLLLRIAGDDVQVVEERGHFRVQDDDDW